MLSTSRSLSEVAHLPITWLGLPYLYSQLNSQSELLVIDSTHNHKGFFKFFYHDVAINIGWICRQYFTPICHFHIPKDLWKGPLLSPLHTSETAITLYAALLVKTFKKLPHFYLQTPLKPIYISRSVVYFP